MVFPQKPFILLPDTLFTIIKMITKMIIDIKSHDAKIRVCLRFRR